MALSGTLDTFALPDVLRLLASTEKTGRLRISGPRGSGSVWVDAGEVVATELTSLNSLDPTDVEVIFGLLRFDAGSFTFEGDAVAPNASSGSAMEPILGAAENMLAEWRSIEEVVPSLDVWVALSPELKGPDVMVDAPRWRCIAVVGSGSQVGVVAETLHMNEVDSCRLVKELIELGLLDKIDAPMTASAPVAAPAPVETAEAQLTSTALSDESATETADADEPAAAIDRDNTADNTVDTAAHVAGDDPDALGVVEAELQIGDHVEADAFESPVAEHESETGGLAPAANAPSFIDESLAEPSTVPSLASLAPSDEPAAANGAEAMFTAATEAEIDSDDLNPAEMARQLANLSPKAAKAVAAAAKATTAAERDAALAAVEAEDGTVNRGLLLKFLGSVDS